MKTTTVLAALFAAVTAFSAPAWADDATADLVADGSADAGKLKVQSIRVEDRFGTIEEERVPAMRSEIRYVPTGSTEGYNLVGAESAQGKTQNVHRKTNELMIPSWKLFTW